MNEATHPLTEFFRREGRRLVSFVRGKIEDSAELEAEDLVQDVFAALFERADPLAEVENLSAYVWRSLRNRVIDALRKRRPTVSLDQPLGDEDGLVLADILASRRTGRLGRIARGRGTLGARPRAWKPWIRANASSSADRIRRPHLPGTFRTVAGAHRDPPLPKITRDPQTRGRDGLHDLTQSQTKGEQP
jgi:RNA polymerase sigma factor (sigma-70 family)